MTEMLMEDTEVFVEEAIEYWTAIVQKVPPRISPKGGDVYVFKPDNEANASMWKEYWIIACLSKIIALYK